MLQFLPYALAAYGGYKGYKGAKDSGASGIGRLLGAAGGAYAGYNLGQVGGFAKNAGFTPYTQLGQNYSGLSSLPFQQTAEQTAAAATKAAAAKTAAGTSTNGEDKRNLLQKLLQRKRIEEGVEGGFTGEYEFDPTKAGIAAGSLAYLSGAFKQQPIDQFQPTYNLGYAEFAENSPGYSYIDPTTGEEKKYEKVYIPEANRPDNVERMGPYEIARTRLKTGGLAEIKKFNEGGINYLPSKVSHDENDANNYVRASGYVEDGAGVGDKDEDTMLAQLADGEFVTRADGVLGAGIIAGANPNSMKDMREKGAQYFYDQQKKYKRVFDLIKDNNEANKEKN